jgi:hypothetical protein
MENLRASRRARVSMMVAYSDGSTSKMGTVQDISMHGMYVHTGSRPEGHDLISATINVDQLGKVIWVTGRVVRRTGSGMAVVFLAGDSRGLGSVMTYLRAS